MYVKPEPSPAVELALTEVESAVQARRHADLEYKRALQAAREAGCSLSEIALAAGISRSGVRVHTHTPGSVRWVDDGVDLDDDLELDDA